MYAATVNVQFYLNVALNGEKRVIAALQEIWKGPKRRGVCPRSGSVSKQADGDIKKFITSNGGYPDFVNLHQSPGSSGHSRVLL